MRAQKEIWSSTERKGSKGPVKASRAQMWTDLIKSVKDKS